MTHRAADEILQGAADLANGFKKTKYKHRTREVGPDPVMIALELVLYGVRHFLDIKKLTFRPALNLVHGGNGTGKTTIADTFFEMLALDKDGPTAQSLAPTGGKDLSQAALIFESQDGGIYRLVRDFLKGNGSLAKLDQDKKFNLLSKDKEQIGGFIHSEIQKLSLNS